MNKIFTYNRILIAVFLCVCVSGSFSQGLDHIPEVSKGNYKPADTSTSFIISTVDVHPMFGGGKQLYDNCIEIFDADTPWPPRWFTSVRSSDNDLLRTDTSIRLDLMYDARVQRDYFTYFRLKSLANEDDDFTNAEFNAFIICNKKMEAIDTLKSDPTMVLDPHDFRINENGEKMALATFDTFLDLRTVSGNKADSNVLASVTVIVIFDTANKEIFRWNSAAVLGVNSAHYGDIGHAAFFKKKNRDWSHGTGALWDYDGNILYCLKNVGLGKISRKDGHVIWRIDRNKIPLISGHDTLAFYSPHDLEQISDTGNYETYSVLSAGDERHPGMYGLIFKVNKETSKVSFTGKKLPRGKIVTKGSGSFEIETNGDYILCYGMYLKNIVNNYHSFMEYHNSSGKIYAEYSVPSYIFIYKTHKLPGWRPPRPEVTISGNTLNARGSMQNWAWYQLSSADKAAIKKVGEGPDFKPQESGNYCVAGAYGIGYAVSLPVSFQK